MLLGTIAYVNAGTQIAHVQSLKGLLSPSLLLSFAALGILPLAAKKIVDLLRARKVYAKWPRPARFDRNLIVIGAGSAGLVSAYIAAAVKAKVTLIEKHRMGGDCLYTGCVPSKALIRSAKLLSQMRHAQHYGIRTAQAEFDFAEVMERVQRVVSAIEPHDSAAALHRTGGGVHPGRSEDHLAVVSRGQQRARHAHAHHAGDRDRRRRRVRSCRPFRALRTSATSRPTRSGGCACCPGDCWCWAVDRSAASWRNASRASGRGHASGDAAAPDDPRGPGDLRHGDGKLPRRRDRPAHRLHSQAVRGRRTARRC